MADTVSLERLVRDLLDGNILPPATIEARLESLTHDGGELPEPGVFLDRLVETRSLTRFQADVLRKGEASTLRIGQYVVLDRIGSGGMGTVHKARHPRMNRIVAIKTLRGEASRKASARGRFEREVQLIAQLNHPNVVMAYDAGESDGCPYLVMEYVDGRDLATEVERNGPLPVAEAVSTILQAARGLAAAHARGLVHRDVKPANFLRDSAGVVKVADLGIARLAEAGDDDEESAHESFTVAGNFLGSASYAAPEQALDAASVDAKADIYALGCTLFFLLAGRPPYQAKGLVGILLKHREAPIPSLREIRPDVPEALDRIFAKMAAKRPEHRFASMDAAIDALEAVRGGLISSVFGGASAASKGPASSNPTLDVELDPSSAEALSVGFDSTGAASTADFASLSVMTVEPSRVQTMLLRRLLEELGVRTIHSAKTGEECLSLLKRTRTDVLVSAMRLDDMDGSELADALRADPKLRKVGLVLAASGSDEEDVVRTVETSRARLLAKPYDAAELGRMISLAARDRLTFASRPT